MNGQNPQDTQTWFVGMDIGGTTVKLCAGHNPCQIEEQVSIASAELSPEQVLQSCIDQIALWTTLWGLPPAAMGIGFPGILSPEGAVLGAPNLPHWVGLNLRHWFEPRLPMPIALANDANAAALAEAEYLAAHQGYSHVLFLTLGTGVGAGMVFNHQIFTGAKGFAAEAGHLTVEPNGFACGCGRKGCLEQYFSSRGILRVAREEFGSDDQSVKQIFKKASQGSELELQILRRSCDALAIGISNLCTLIDPDCIVLGGGISKDGDLLLDLLEPALRQRVRYPGYTLPDLRISHYHEKAGSIGCLLLASQVVSQPSK